MRPTTATIVYYDLSDPNSTPEVVTHGPSGPQSSHDSFDSDDLSPPPKRSRPRGTAPLEEECVVCGDKASGYHYNALTCEGCKGFFRRSIHRDIHYNCQSRRNCTVDMYMRRKCQYCRLQKCLRNGMRADLVVPEDQCRMKREAKQKKKPTMIPRKEWPMQENQLIQEVSPEVALLTKRVVELFLKTETPSEEILLSLSTSSSNSPNSVRKLFTELIILEAQLIHHFIKRLPGFSLLSEDDRKVIQRGAKVDLILLRLAHRFDSATDTMVFGSECQPFRFTQEQYIIANPHAQCHAIFDFCRSFSRLKPDIKEFCILMGIVTFSEREGLTSKADIQATQEAYTSALQESANANPTRRRGYFGKILMKLAELNIIRDSE